MIQTEEQARTVANMISSGKLEGEAKTRAMADLAQYGRDAAARAKQVQPTPEQGPGSPGGYTPKEDSWDKIVADAKNLDGGDMLYALWDAATLAGSSMVAQPVSGIAGLATGLGTYAATGDKNKATEYAANVQRYMEDAITAEPDGEAAQVLMRAVGPSVEAATRWADDAFYSVAGGNAELASAIKTAAYGIPAIVGLKRMKLPERMKTELDQRGIPFVKEGQLKKAARETEEMGISMDTETLPQSVKAVGERMVPDPRRGAGFEAVLDELRATEKASRAKINEAYELARSTEAGAPIKPLQKAAAGVEKDLIELGYDLESMPVTSKRLAEFKTLATTQIGTGKKVGGAAAPKPTGATSVDGVFDQISAEKGGGAGRTEMALNELEILRKRIGMRTGNPTEDRALRILRKQVDETVDELFEKAAISGNSEAVTAWKKARSLNRSHETRFNSDRTLRKLLLSDATPEDAYRFVFGASAMNAKSQAVNTVRSMKKVLGEDHPAMVSMRNAVLRDTMMPLLADKTNFARTVDNIDKLLRNNYTLVGELGINVPELRKLRRAAHLAQSAVNLAPEKFGAGYVNSVAASVLFGHQIARKGALVRTARKILNRWIGVGLMSKNTMRKHLLEADYDTPIIQYSTPELTTWMAMTAAADASKDTEQDGQ